MVNCRYEEMKRQGKPSRGVMCSLTSWHNNSMNYCEKIYFYLIEMVIQIGNDYCLTVFIGLIIEVKLDPS